MAGVTGALQDARHHFASRLQSALTLEEVSAAFTGGATAVVPAHSVGVYRLDVDSGEVLDVRSDATSSFLEDYESYGRTDDPVLNFVMRHTRPIDSSRAVSADAWESCGARSALGEAGLGHSMEAPLSASGVLLGTINFARPAVSAAFDDADLVSARLISEQLGLAMERAIRFEATGQRATMMEEALDRFPQAVVVTDLDAQVLYRNRAARNSADLLSPRAARGPDATVADSIAEAMAEFRLHGKRVHVRSLRQAGTDGHRIVKTYKLGEQQGAAVTLIFECGDGRPETDRLPAWDVLSRREQEIAQLVSEGLTTKQIAERAFISENTVKQHLKRVFAKTDVRNRAELIQLIWSSGAKPPGARDDG